MKNFLCIYFFHRAHSCSYLGHFLGRIITASYDKAVKAWDLETGKLLVSVARPGDLDWAWEGLLWGWRLGWDGKPVFQKRRILSGIPGDGGGERIGEGKLLGAGRGGLLLEGWEAFEYTRRGSEGEWGMAFQAKGTVQEKSLPHGAVGI